MLRATEWRQTPALLLAALRYGSAAVAVWVSLEYTDDAIGAVINASLLLLPLSLMLALSGRQALSLSFAALTAIFIWALGELKLKYFGDRLALPDYYFLTEPANWNIALRYPLLWQSLIGFFLGVVLLAVDAWLDARSRPRAGRRQRVAALLLFLLLSGFAWAERHHHEWEVWREDADCGDMHICGVMTRLVASVAVFEFEMPVHEGDPQYFLAHQAALPPLPAAAAHKPDIVAFLNESTFDLRNFVLPRARLPRLGMFDDSALTRAGGPLRMHTYGGKTWLSEFSLLTGLIPEDFGAWRNLVFNTVAPNTQTNLVKLLKANGYKTIVLMPTMKYFYGAGRTYEGLGFDRILTLRDFPEYDYLPGDCWDIAETPRMVEAAIKLIKQHRAGPDKNQPLFLYFLSVFGHAPYSKKTPVSYGLERTTITPTLAAKFSDYLNRMQTLNAAITQLDHYLAGAERPALWTWFGDHQAYYEEDVPPYRYRFPAPDHVTQFQLRGNFNVPTLPDLAITDVAYLPSLLADLAGVEEDAHFSSLSAMRRLCEGKLDDCADAQLVQSYKAWLFSPEQGLFEQ